MTALPSDKAESQNIHWRAVPSLREIWQEERRRMARLLEPEHDFLTRQSQTNKDLGEKAPPFTLSVKKGASTPGAKLAAKGMKRLLGVTMGLDKAFMRALKQIVNRHSAAISQVDALLNSDSPTSRKMLSARLMPEPTTSSQLTPTFDEALGALDALAGQHFGQCQDHAELSDSETSALSDMEHEIEDKKGTDDGNWGYCSSQILDASDGQNRGGFRELTQTYYKSHYEPRKRLSDETCFALSQRIDRGEGIVDGPFKSAEDFIDPKTLVPYESLDDEDDNPTDGMDKTPDGAALEKELTKLANEMVRQGEKPPLLGSNQTNDADYSEEPQGGISPSYDLDIPSSDSSEVNHSRDGHSSDESVVKSGRAPQGKDSRITGSRKARRFSMPPTRGCFLDFKSSLNPLPMKRETPAWLSHAKTYESYRDAEKKSKWTPPVPREGLYVQPTRPPPRRDEVWHWCRRETKRLLPQVEFPVRKKEKVVDSRKVKDIAPAIHKIDDNTGKVILDGTLGSSRDNGSANLTRYGQVEEVRWMQSQTQSSAMTQELEEKARRCQAEPRHEQARRAKARTPKLTAASVLDSQAMLKVAADLSLVSPMNLTKGQDSQHALKGMQNQGGRLVVEGGGQLKAKTRPTQSETGTAYLDRYLPSPLTILSIEVHVQCRVGRAGVRTSHEIAMTPDPDRDTIFAVAYAFARDPGGGEALEILERGCLYVPLEAESGGGLCDTQVKSSLPRNILGVTSPLTVASVRDEKQMLLRLASIVRWKDPDILLSWDTQGSGVGYIVERGAKLKCEAGPVAPENGTSTRSEKLDMARLLGRLPKPSSYDKGGTGQEFFERGAGSHSEADKGSKPKGEPTWAGSGMGSDWDENVGAGEAAASIVSNDSLVRSIQSGSTRLQSIRCPHSFIAL
jgi:hypothetical protein